MSNKVILFLEIGEGYKIFTSFKKLEDELKESPSRKYIEENFNNKAYVITIGAGKLAYVFDRHDYEDVEEGLLREGLNIIGLTLPLSETIEFYKNESKDGVLTKDEKNRAAKRYFNRVNGIEDPNIKIIKQDKSKKQKWVKINL